MAEYLPEKDRKTMEELFKRLDRGKQGRITQADMVVFLKKLSDSYNFEFVERLFETVDRDGSGYLTFSEFSDLMAQILQKQRSPEDEFRSAFELFDQNCDGKISATEIERGFRAMGSELSQKEIEALMKKLDTNGDGIVDYMEFRAWLANMPGSPKKRQARSRITF